jgi:hypothetical protein
MSKLQYLNFLQEPELFHVTSKPDPFPQKDKVTALTLLVVAFVITSFSTAAKEPMGLVTPKMVAKHVPEN